MTPKILGGGGGIKGTKFVEPLRRKYVFTFQFHTRKTSKVCCLFISNWYLAQTSNPSPVHWGVRNISHNCCHTIFVVTRYLCHTIVVTLSKCWQIVCEKKFKSHYICVTQYLCQTIFVSNTIFVQSLSFQLQSTQGMCEVDIMQWWGSWLFQLDAHLSIFHPLSSTVINNIVPPSQLDRVALLISLFTVSSKFYSLPCHSLNRQLAEHWCLSFDVTIVSKIVENMSATFCAEISATLWRKSLQHFVEKIFAAL